MRSAGFTAGAQRRDRRSHHQQREQEGRPRRSPRSSDRSRPAGSTTSAPPPAARARELTNSETISSSNDRIIAISSEDSTAGMISGRVTCRKVRPGRRAQRRGRLLELRILHAQRRGHGRPRHTGMCKHGVADDQAGQRAVEAKAAIDAEQGRRRDHARHDDRQHQAGDDQPRARHAPAHQRKDAAVPSMVASNRRRHHELDADQQRVGPGRRREQHVVPAQRKAGRRELQEGRGAEGDDHHDDQRRQQEDGHHEHDACRAAGATGVMPSALTARSPSGRR